MKSAYFVKWALWDNVPPAGTNWSGIVYLKSLEMVGFKSFADKTKLVFEPGMTCIVGPNGCGKSNVADAISWVLGEQKPTALRGSQMTDCIFNGTQNRKPLGMAEVNITFADCEGLLSEEYNEMTVTRRVFGSGEGQYFINKTPCRLKDLQRLFMDTGIGTASYSFMAQGRIDQILSSRPEDRRTIFEEASGITKFKADKKEAIRKLEHTEANLLRLADVIREVKRQIGSLQRQAGKARRYRSLQEELQTLDIYATRNRLTAVDKSIRNLEAKITKRTDAVAVAHREVDQFETASTELRQSVVAIERTIGTSMEAGAQAQSRLDRTHDVMRMNAQRVEEYESWAKRDAEEVKTIRQQIEDRKQALLGLTDEAKTVQEAFDSSKKEMATATESLNRHREAMDASRTALQQMRDEAFALESLAARLQNEMVELEAQQRSSVIERERLAAEKSHLSKRKVDHEARLTELRDILAKLREELESTQNKLTETEKDHAATQTAIRESQQRRADAQRSCAALDARLELLSDAEEVQGDFPPGTKLLMDEDNPLQVSTPEIVGSLASLIDTPPEFATAVEAALRANLDAIVMTNDDVARAIVLQISGEAKGSTRLLTPVDLPDTPIIPAECGRALRDLVSCSDQAAPLVNRLLANVYVLDSADQIPSVVPAGLTYVTNDGILVERGRIEFWMNDAGTSNPLARKSAIGAAREELSSHQRIVSEEDAVAADLGQHLTELTQAIEQTRAARDNVSRALAQKEGEEQIVARDATAATERLEAVAWELGQLEGMEEWDSQRAALAEKQTTGRKQREKLSADITERTRVLDELDRRNTELQGIATECRIKHANLTQRVEHMQSRQSLVEQRIAELEDTSKGRADGILSYQANIDGLKKEIASSQGRLAAMEAEVVSATKQADDLRAKRETVGADLAASEKELALKRTQLETLIEERSAMELECSECKMRRQNQVERVTGDYSLSIEDIMDATDPEWDKAPSLDEAETRVAELKAKLDAMGPVNLVAIEEYKDHEERYAFLTAQEEDLVSSKQQLMEMIKKINVTTSEMFEETFVKANENFQVMFERLFGGGAAKLVLVNEEDVLDCGIEIIARPPGKRLQNISLLSGGERTLTAVALLFAIYMIKPSPFCLLDELDAPLDDTNIGRFTSTLQEFVKQSQFVVITHNRQTISTASVLYGVTMPERGVSKIVSMKFRDADGGIVTEDGETVKDV